MGNPHNHDATHAKLVHTHTKADAGLGNCDNTSDANKPVSTAQQTALNAKIDKSVVTAAGDLVTASAASTPSSLAIGADGQGLKVVAGVPVWAAMNFVDVSSEVSITGAVTLTTAAFGKMHVCTGTTADYTVGLPAASGNAGKLIGIRISNACTKLVTLDANASELIDGAATRIMWAGESAILLCDGAGWTKIAGKYIPMICKMNANAVQSIPSAAAVMARFDAVEIDNASMGSLANNSVTIRRAGFYTIVAHASLASDTTWQIIMGNSSVRATNSGLLPTLVSSAKHNAGAAIGFVILQNSGAAVNTDIWPYPYLSVQEVVQW